MATAIIMPKLGISVESCILTKWHKKKGDEVKKGDILFSYETDKSAADEESTVDGILLDVFYNEDDDVPCLNNVCVIGNAGESTAEFAPAGAADPAPVAEAAPAEAPAAVAAPVAAPVVTAAQGDMMKISPRAKGLAEKSNADLRFAAPTGPEGRIIERDVRKLIADGVLTTSAAAGVTDKDAVGTGIGGRVTTGDTAAPAAVSAPAAAPAAAEEEVTVARLTNIRKVIAKQMVESLSTMAQLTQSSTFDATEIMAFRAKLKEKAEPMGLANITLNDIILYAAAKTLADPQFKSLNAHLIGDEMHYFKNVHMGVAVDTERGLMVPTIFNANKLTLNDIAVQSKALANDCKKGAISPDKLKGASFTVSNVGAFGVEVFTPVINPPQTAILGVTTIVKRPKEVNGEIKLYPAMGLSLTFDHRALDGADAARFLKALSANLESFSLLMAK
ncbi:MAG: 2-oxo acid dehydrogenase subunit E2 [Ruminococcaceae bacterium]|nr:2-oxo acid dehydrogenase subunit E2 [Oscillospiraceae bacterium]